jgi:phytoene synthase
MAEPKDDLDAQLRTADPDRWLSSRFIGEAARRADVVALYALDAELARAARRASQPMLGEIRLAWWRERIEALFQGEPAPAHPVLAAVAEAIARRDLPEPLLIDPVEARIRDLDSAPFADEAGALAYVDRTAGASTAAALRILDPAADPHLGRAAARAWGLSLLLAGGRIDPELGRQALARARAAARRDVARLSAEAFPAVAHAALARASGRRPGPLEARLRLIAAIARGTV